MMRLGSATKPRVAARWVATAERSAGRPAGSPLSVRPEAPPCAELLEQQLPPQFERKQRRDRRRRVEIIGEPASRPATARGTARIGEAGIGMTTAGRAGRAPGGDAASAVGGDRRRTCLSAGRDSSSPRRSDFVSADDGVARDFELLGEAAARGQLRAAQQTAIARSRAAIARRSVRSGCRGRRDRGAAGVAWRNRGLRARQFSLAVKPRFARRATPEPTLAPSIPRELDPSAPAGSRSRMQQIGRAPASAAPALAHLARRGAVGAVARAPLRHRTHRFRVRLGSPAVGPRRMQASPKPPASATAKSADADGESKTMEPESG